MRFGTYYFLQAPPSIPHPDVVRREIEQMTWTEELGFDSIWLTEHHFIDYGLSVSPAVLAAAAAMRTRRGGLGPAAGGPPLPHPGSPPPGACACRHPEREGSRGRRRPR